jgi:hypothetical protein
MAGAFVTFATGETPRGGRAHGLNGVSGIVAGGRPTIGQERGERSEIRPLSRPLARRSASPRAVRIMDQHGSRPMRHETLEAAAPGAEHFLDRRFIDDAL